MLIEVPPTAGEGGNTAIRDAGVLLKHLITVASADDLRSAFDEEIPKYERDMLEFSWTKISDSCRNAKLITMEGYIFPYVVRGIMRILNLFFGAR